MKLTRPLRCGWWSVCLLFAVIPIAAAVPLQTVIIDPPSPDDAPLDV